MTTLVNLSPNSKTPLLIDAEDLTSIQMDSRGETMSFFNSKGHLVNIDAKRWGIKLDAAMQTLAEQGFPLVPLPLRIEGKEHPRFFAPGAVTFIMVSQPNAKDRVGATIGIKGLGGQDTCGTTAPEVEALLDAVRKCGTPLLECPNENIHSPWYNLAASLHIDPRAVTCVDQASNEVELTFDNGGRLRVRMDIPDNTLKTAVRLKNENPKAYPDLNDAFQEASRQQQNNAAAAMTNFLSGIASASGPLTLVESRSRTLYIRPQDVAYAFTSDDDAGKTYTLSLSPRAAQSGSVDSIHLRFDSPEDRAAALAALNQTPPSGPKGKPAKPAPKT